MASGRNNAARKYEDQVPAQREVQPKRHLQVAAAPVKKKKHRRKPAVMQGVYPCIFLVAITAAFILFCQMQLTQLTAEASEQSDLLSELQSENVSLTTKQMNSMNMDEVEQYATDTLGMVKLDNSQIEYVELTNPASCHRCRRQHDAARSVERTGSALFRTCGIYPISS